MHRLNKIIRIGGMKGFGCSGFAKWILAQHRGKAILGNTAIKSEVAANLRSEPVEPVDTTKGLEFVDLDSPGDKEILLALYEDRKVDIVMEPPMTDQSAGWIGHDVGRSISMVIIRDPFSFFMSRIEAELSGTYSFPSWRFCFSQGDADLLWEMWKSYARKYIEFRNSSSEDEISVSYNHWAMRKTYRDWLACRVGASNNNDDTWKTATAMDACSSIEVGEWQNTDEHQNRWNYHRDHPVFQRLVENQEVMQLAKAIFGDVMAIPA